MKFRTKIEPINFEIALNHESKIIMLGSCFASNIGQKLVDHHFKVKANPFGIVFNPSSILKQLKNDKYDSAHLIEYNHSVNSLDFHSKYNAQTKKAFYQKLSEDQNQFQLDLKKADCLILTFGTAWIYKYKKTNKVIANCQKRDSTLFLKELLDLQTLVKDYKSYFNLLLQNQTNLKIILTVSPVRHLKDGLTGNNRSKATLILLCEALSKSFPNEIIYYPSYELIIDDLRDYRFFEKDLLHPNSMAIDYIYDHFKMSFFSQETIELTLLIEKYKQLKNHVNINSSTEDMKLCKKKLDDLESKIKRLKLS